jgi:hypothetical protein
MEIFLLQVAELVLSLSKGGRLQESSLQLATCNSCLPIHTTTTLYPILCQSSASFSELAIQRWSSFQYGEISRIVFTHKE